VGNLQGLYGIWLREFKVFQRERSRVISSMVTPLMFIVILGGGLGSTVDLGNLGGGFGYQTFIFPGILLMLTMMGSIFFGLYIVWDRRIDVLKEVLVSPVSRTAIFFGKVLGGCTDVLIQVCILLCIGILFVPTTPASVGGSLAIALLVAIGMVALGLSIGSFFESLEGFQVIVSFLVYPLFFLSGALFPLDPLPAWLKTASYVDPLTYAVDALRTIQLGIPSSIPLAIDFMVMGAFAAGMVLLGTLGFRRMR